MQRREIDVAAFSKEWMGHSANGYQKQIDGHGHCPAEALGLDTSEQ